jgi:hypothetical protein
MAWEPGSFAGLCAMLDGPTTVPKACQAVEECIAANKCAARPPAAAASAAAPAFTLANSRSNCCLLTRRAAPLLLRRPRDNLRGFFEACFPRLLGRVFGYSGPSWLALAARGGGRDGDARALLRLLSPSGALFAAMASADADGAVEFAFPRERLPAHTQLLLASPAGRAVAAAWPQFGGDRARGAAEPVPRAHLRVGCFQYFCYWFAFSAVKGSADAGGGGGGFGGGFGGASAAGAPGGFALSSVRRAAESLHLTRGRDADPAAHRPYLALLRHLLLELIPRAGPAGGGGAPAAAPPPRGAGAAAALRSPMAARGGGGAAAAAARGALFYSVVVEFWLKDADEPLPSGAAGAAAGRAGGAGAWASSYEPPSEDLLEAVGELARYATVAADARGAPRPAQAGAPWLPLSPVLAALAPLGGAARRGHGGAASLAGPPRLGGAAAPGSQALMRQLYRFFRRALTAWPPQRSLKPLLRALLPLLAPWLQAGAAAPAAAPGAAATAGAAPPAAGGLAARASAVAHRVQWLDGALGGAPPAPAPGAYGPEWEAHVLAHLPLYLDLPPLLLEACAARVGARGESAAQDAAAVFGPLGAAPALAELLRRAEGDVNRAAAAGAAPRRADGPLAELVPWLLEQVADWRAVAAATALGDSPAACAGAGAAGYALFAAVEGGGPTAARELLDAAAGALRPEAADQLRRCLEAVLPVAPAGAHGARRRGAAPLLGAPDAPRLPRCSWRDVRYRGDPLHRPVASYEVGALVRPLVAASEALNAALGLGGAPAAAGVPPPEDRLQEALARARRAGWRVDLRPLADARLLFWLPVAWVAARLLLRLLWFVAAALLLPGEAARAPAAPRHRAWERDL